MGRRPYTPTQEMNYEKCGCDSRAAGLPGYLIAAIADRDADQKISGGFRIDKRNLCGKCFTYRSANGTCNCP